MLKVGDRNMSVLGLQLSTLKIGNRKLSVLGPQLSMLKVET